MLKKLVTILFLSGDPMSVNDIASILKTTSKEIEECLPELNDALTSIGLSLLRNNDGLSIVTEPEQSSLVEDFRKEELKGELTPAALQVLTLVAYLGNPTREQISYIRGVQSSQSIRTLTVRGLINRNNEVCTLTSEAMKHLGVTAVNDLPEYDSIHKSLSEKLQTREI